MKSIAILGAGSHTRSLLNLINKSEYNIVGIYDDNYHDNEIINDISLKGKIKDIPNESKIFLSIGDNSKREFYFNKFKNQILQDNLIHTSACIEEYAKLGIANALFGGTFINSNATIGNNNIINTYAIIEHEVVIGNHNHISVNSTICGRVVIGDRCFIGAKAVIIDKISICDDVIVGAGSVVIRDLNEPGVYVGNPVRKIK